MFLSSVILYPFSTTTVFSSIAFQCNERWVDDHVLRTRAALLGPFIDISGDLGVFASGVCERTCGDVVCIRHKRYPGVESAVDIPRLPRTNQVAEELG